MLSKNKPVIELIRWTLLLAAACGAVVVATGPSQTPTVPPTPTREDWDEALSTVIDWHRRELRLEVQVSDQQVLRTDLSTCSHLTVVQIDAGRLSDTAAAHLAKLPNLRHLRLVDCPITDAAAIPLSRRTSLRVLNLPDCRMTAIGLAQFSGSELQTLRIGSPELGDDACEAIASIHTLDSLHLIGIPVDWNGLRQLAAMPNLHNLYLDGSNTPAEAVRWLIDNHPQLHVHIDQLHPYSDHQH